MGRSRAARASSTSLPTWCRCHESNHADRARHEHRRLVAPHEGAFTAARVGRRSQLHHGYRRPCERGAIGFTDGDRASRGASAHYTARDDLIRPRIRLRRARPLEPRCAARRARAAVERHRRRSAQGRACVERRLRVHVRLRDAGASCALVDHAGRRAVRLRLRIQRGRRRRAGREVAMTSIFNFADLIEPATDAEVESKYYEILGTIGVTTTQWSPGSVLRTYIEGTSILVSALSQVMALMTRSGYLEFSEGDWLTQVAHYVYGVDRIQATYATGKITLTNAGGALYSLGPGDLIVSNPTTRKTYRNEAAIVLNPLSTVIDIPIVAVEAGADSTSAAGAITQLVTTLLRVTVTNDAAVVGSDEELDPQLRDRC